MTHIQRTVSVVALLVVPVISRAQILAKVHALSLAGGCMVPGRDAVLNRVLSLRLADVEAGARLTSAYGVTARVVAIDAFPSYYYGWGKTRDTSHIS